MCEKILSNAVPRSMIGNDPGRVKWIASHPAFVPAHLSLGGNIKLKNPKGLKIGLVMIHTKGSLQKHKHLFEWIANHIAILPAHLSLGVYIKLQNLKGGLSFDMSWFIYFWEP